MTGVDYVMIAIIAAFVIIECSRHRSLVKIAELAAEEKRRAALREEKGE